jgi:hypothetical protein
MADAHAGEAPQQEGLGLGSSSHTHLSDIALDDMTLTSVQLSSPSHSCTKDQHVGLDFESKCSEEADHTDDEQSCKWKTPEHTRGGAYILVMLLVKRERHGHPGGRWEGGK